MEIRSLHQDPAAAFAERELKHYLNRMGSPQLHYTLNVAVPAAQGMEEVPDPELDDQYCITVNARQQQITGNNPRALLLAVYRYLSLIGCRFLRPGKAFEIVPVHRNPWDFYAHEQHTASLRHRGVCIEGCDSIENIADFLDWLPKIGCNSFFFQFKTPHTFLKRWYDYRTGTNGFWSEAGSRQAASCFDRLMAERGLLRHRVGHGWTAEILGAENSTGWEAEKRDISDNVRGMIAQVNGKRELTKQIAINTNLCFSNPDSLESFGNCVVKYLTENPDTEYLHIWLADGHHNCCECERCRDLRPSDHYITLMNYLDSKLTKRSIDTKLCLLMYQDLLWPPLKNRLNNPARFALLMAPIHRTFSKSYGDVQNKTPLPVFQLNSSPFPKDIASNLAFLEAWKEAVPCDSFVYDYHLGRAHHSDPSHIKISKILHSDLKVNAQIGLNGIISCQELRIAFPNSLANYVMGRTALDTQCTFEELAQEYYIACYGNSGLKLLAVMEELSSCFDGDYMNRMFCPTPRINADIAGSMEKVPSILSKVEKLICDHENCDYPVQKFLWNELNFFVQYTAALSKMIRLRASGKLAETKAVFENQFQPLLTAHEHIDQASIDVMRVLALVKHALCTE